MTLAIPVHLVDHDSRWSQQAARLMERLAQLGDVILAVHHIGSTSIPGLVAKPVIDMMPLVARLELLDSRRADVEALGLGWHGEFGVDGRRFCTLDAADGTRIANFHFYAMGSPHILRHLAFRDYLRSDPTAAAAYAEEKARARALHPDNSVAYSAEKGAWIRATETRAIDWYVGEARQAC